MPRTLVGVPREPEAARTRCPLLGLDAGARLAGPMRKELKGPWTEDTEGSQSVPGDQGQRQQEGLFMTARAAAWTGCYPESWA